MDRKLKEHRNEFLEGDTPATKKLYVYKYVNYRVIYFLTFLFNVDIRIDRNYLKICPAGKYNCRMFM